MQAQSNGIGTRPDLSHVDPAFGNWLAGFVDGEGSFMILRHTAHSSYRCEFAIALRMDDRPMLEEIRDTLGIGRVYDRWRHAKSNPSSFYTVGKKVECRALVHLFDRHPLRAKKRHDYAIWRQAAIELANQRSLVGKNGLDWGRMAELKAALIEGRRYLGPMTEPPRIKVVSHVQYELPENEWQIT